MCVYTVQDEDVDDKYLSFKKRIEQYKLPKSAHWIEKPDSPSMGVKEWEERSPVIGIGNWATIMLRHDQEYFWNWAQFAPALRTWPKAAPRPYFNARVEKLEDYLEKDTDDLNQFQQGVVESLNERMCVLWVNGFFESDGHPDNDKKRWFHIYPQKYEYLPLACFYHVVDNPDQGVVKNSFTIVTRDPYDLVAKTGHERSPGILRYQDVERWLTPGVSPKEKLEMLAYVDEQPFGIDQVERFNLTKKTSEARVPVEGGKLFAQGSMMEL